MSLSKEASCKRTVVLVGRTGAGKSSCGNTLANTTNSFTESDGSVSETKCVDAKTFVLDWSGKEYEVTIVDTIGIGDTQLSADEVLLRLAEACSECSDGINAVFFVTGGRFTVEEADAWDIMWQVLFGKEVLEHTTIVRTKFRKFQDHDAVKEDRSKLEEEGGPAASRILPHVENFLYVDNPPLQYGGQEHRKHSREILLNHLILNCDKSFVPPVMNEVKQRVTRHVEAHRKMIEEYQQLQSQLKEARDEIERARIESELQENERERNTERGAMTREMEAIVDRQARQLGVAEQFFASVGRVLDEAPEIATVVVTVLKAVKTRCCVM